MRDARTLQLLLPEAVGASRSIRRPQRRHGHAAKLEVALRRCWPDGRTEPWRRPCEIFKLLTVELEAMGCSKREGGLPSLSTLKRWWAARTNGV